MYVVTAEKCFKCGQLCNPVVLVYSAKKQRNLPLCGKCAPGWLEGGRMPE